MLRLLAILFLFPASVLAELPARVAAGEVKDRKNFIPYRKYHSVPGKAVGILVKDVRNKMSHEGRSGPPNAMAFSRNGGSYRWMYVPSTGPRALITNFSIKAGKKGEQKQTYPRLNMADPTTIQQWKMKADYALVEVEVNRNAGAPPQEGFVATRMKRLDGTKAFPLQVSKLVAAARKRFEKDIAAKKVDAAMRQSQGQAIGDKKPTGPREQKTLMYLTWMAKEERLRIHFLRTITDGDYKWSQGGARPIRPFPLPPPPGQGIRPVPVQPVSLPPPPPVMPKVRYGTSFGIEIGMAYVYDKGGKLVAVETVSAKAFKKVIPPPPQIGVRPFDPVRPRPIPRPRPQR